MEIIGFILVPLIFIGMGLFILSLNNGWFQKDSTEYKEYPGKIIDISKYESGINPQGKNLVTYGAKLIYKYEVNGKKYKNDVIYKNADTVASSDETRADRFIREYPVGKIVSVKVNQHDINDTYLIEESPATGFFNFLSFIMIAIGASVLLYNW